MSMAASIHTPPESHLFSCSQSQSVELGGENVRESNNLSTPFSNLFKFQLRGQGKGYPCDRNSYDLRDQGSGCVEIRASFSSPRAALPCPSHVEAR